MPNPDNPDKEPTPLSGYTKLHADGDYDDEDDDSAAPIDDSVVNAKLHTDGSSTSVLCSIPRASPYAILSQLQLFVCLQSK